MAVLNIPNQDFTQEAMELFDIIKQKLEELHIEQNEAKEYFRVFTKTDNNLILD